MHMVKKIQPKRKGADRFIPKSKKTNRPSAKHRLHTKKLR
jgi:hypothetical protein